MDEPQPSSSTTFDPHAVAPAFARTSHAGPPQQQLPLQPAADASTSSSVAAGTSAETRPQQWLVVPALGDPSLMGELPTTDPLSILLQKHIPPHIRPLRDLSGIWHTPTTASAPSQEIPDPFSLNNESAAETIDAETVRHAAASNSWRKIASLARIKIGEYYQRHSTPQLVDMQDDGGVGEVLQWWSVRLYALTRLKLYSMLRTEMGALWQVLSTTADGEVMLADSEAVPFTLRVLKATEPKFRGEVRTTLEQYTALVRMCKRNMRQSGAEYEVWRSRAERVGLMLAYTLAEARDFAGAIELLVPLMERCLSGQGSEEAEVHFVMVASRIWIQAGDFTSATHLLTRASSLLPPTSPLLPALTHSHSLIHTISSSTSSPPPSIPTPASQLNAAITAFYAAQLDSSLRQLEQLLATHPQLACSDALVFNLATLYELGPGSDDEVVARKRDVLDKVARFAGEPGVSGSCFKL